MSRHPPRRIEPIGATIRLTFDGREVEACQGDTVASALIAAGIRDLRSSVVSGAPRGAYCMMGACFDCLVEIDGQPNRQACMTPARGGQVVRRQQGAPAVRGLA